MGRTPAQTSLDHFGGILESVPSSEGFVSQNRPDHFGMVIGDSHAFITESLCSDGISDNWYGLTIEMFSHVNCNTVLLSGCCSIAPN